MSYLYFRVLQPTHAVVRPRNSCMFSCLEKHLCNLKICVVRIALDVVLYLKNCACTELYVLYSIVSKFVLATNNSWEMCPEIFSPVFGKFVEILYFSLKISEMESLQTLIFSHAPLLSKFSLVKVNNDLPLPFPSSFCLSNFLPEMNGLD